MKMKLKQFWSNHRGTIKCMGVISITVLTITFLGVKGATKIIGEDAYNDIIMN